MQGTSRHPRRPITRLATGVIVGVAALQTSGSVWAQELPRPHDEVDETPRTARPNRIPRVLPTEEELRGMPIDPELRLLARQLGDPSWDRREQAMQTLLQRGAPIGQLCAVLGQDDLSPEQQHRLLLVVRQQLLTAPRGAVGIRVNPRWPGNAIVVEELLADLPAAEVLQVGDRITHLQGIPLRNFDDFRLTVQFLAPGDRITMTVERRVGEKPAEDDPKRMVPVLDAVEVTLELGSAEKLIDSTTGLPLRSKKVEDARLTQANAAVRRYAPRPRSVEIDGEDALGLVVETPVTSLEIDDHPAIRALAQDLRQLAIGRIELTVYLRRHWMQQLAELQQQAFDSALSAHERELMMRVAEQYARMVRTAR